MESIDAMSGSFLNMGSEHEQCLAGMDATHWGGQNQSNSNLQSFLKFTTPTVHCLSIPKANARDIDCLWQPIGKDTIEFFHLANLWEQYHEWSAYGAGVPIHLKRRESVIQYYTPYLSAIQIFTSMNHSTSRKGSDERECKKLSKSLNEATISSSLHEGSWPTRDHTDHLYFEYSDFSSPYERLPLAAKIYELAKDSPMLMKFRSVDLSPACWMSVAWYPIYQIPGHIKVKELSTCFLTYHTISSFQGHIPTEADKGASELGNIAMKYQQFSRNISLPAFGLAAHKMQGNLWKKPRAGDADKFAELNSAASSWLKQLRFHHHDFNYFSMSP